VVRGPREVDRAGPLDQGLVEVEECGGTGHPLNAIQRVPRL
jgi:hypothetical protein